MLRHGRGRVFAVFETTSSRIRERWSVTWAIQSVSIETETDTDTRGPRLEAADWHDLYTAHAQSLYHYVVRRVGESAAEDIVADAGFVALKPVACLDRRHWQHKAASD
jgi:hypothetical protein